MKQKTKELISVFIWSFWICISLFFLYLAVSNAGPFSTYHGSEWGCEGKSGTSGGAADYCSTQTWNTLTEFRLDFDHTTDNKTACLTSGTEIGTLVSGTVIDTPSVTPPGSGGDVLIANASGEYIVFDNSTTYFNSQYGTLKFKFRCLGDNANNYDLINIIEVMLLEK